MNGKTEAAPCELCSSSPNAQSADLAKVPDKNRAAIALLQSWLQTEATDDPEEIQRTEEELAEFKQRMNANRAATGERLVFPEKGVSR